MSRRDKEGTRELLLKTGYEMILDQGPDVGWGIRITEVTKRVGLTTGAAYQIWNGSRTVDGMGGQDRFHHDLALYAFDQVIADTRSYNARRAVDLAEGGTSLDRIIQRVGEDNAIAKAAPNRFACFVALLASAHAEPELGDVGRRAYAAVTDSLVDVYRKVFEQFDMEMTPPFTIEQLITAVIALIDGLRMRSLVDPDLSIEPVDPPADAGADADGTWYLMSTAIRALVQGMTRPTHSN